MELIKFLLGIVADPVVHVFVFILLTVMLKAMRRWRMFAFVYLYFMATPLSHNALSSFWSVSNKVDYSNTYDYIVLLTGISDYKWHMKYSPVDRMGYCNLNQNADRLGYVLQEMKSGRVNRLLLGRNLIGDFDETSCIVDLLSQQGISQERMVVIDNVSNTLDEIKAVKKFMNRVDSFGRVLMVTSSDHMRRAVSFSNKVKINVDNYSVGRTDIQFSMLEVIPKSKWLEKNRILFYEMVAYLGYKLSGDL